MPAKIYRIKLTEEERTELRAIADSGRAAKERRRRANILLMCDEGEHGSGFVDSDIASATGCTPRTVERTRADCFAKGPAEAVDRKKRDTPPRPRLLDGRKEAQLTKLACNTPPPEGHARWALRLLAGELVELEIVDAISHTTVHNALKKTRSSPGS
jgi:hypothetical protein